jgi:hypothetical protein
MARHLNHLLAQESLIHRQPDSAESALIPLKSFEYGRIILFVLREVTNEVASLILLRLCVRRLAARIEKTQRRKRRRGAGEEAAEKESSEAVLCALR